MKLEAVTRDERVLGILRVLLTLLALYAALWVLGTLASLGRFITIHPKLWKGSIVGQCVSPAPRPIPSAPAGDGAVTPNFRAPGAPSADDFAHLILPFPEGFCSVFNQPVVP